MSSFAILLAVGLASAACQIAFSLSVNRLRLLLFNLGASSLFLVQYFLLGQWIGFYSGLIGTAYTLVLALAYRWPVLQHRALTFVAAAGYIGTFAYLNDWEHLELHQAVPLVGGIAILFALHTRNLIATKATFITAGVLWLAYEFSNTMYTQMLGEGFELIGNTVALCLLIKAALANRAARVIQRAHVAEVDTELLEVIKVGQQDRAADAQSMASVG